MITSDPILYLKEHIGCKYSIAEYGKHLRKWTKGSLLTEKDIKRLEINCCGELPNEITLESDYKGKDISKNKENQDNAEEILKKAGAGYYISSHKGKSDYIRFRFKTSKPITPSLRLQIIKYMAKPSLHFDEAFFSLNYVRPVPNRPHWKHTEQLEKVIKVVEGEDLDIDKLGIAEPAKPVKMVKSGSCPNVEPPKGWACSISIEKMAKRKGLTNCPNCNNPFKFDDLHGLYSCNSCNSKGNLKGFASLIITNTTNNTNSTRGQA